MCRGDGPRQLHRLERAPADRPGRACPHLRDKHGSSARRGLSWTGSGRETDMTSAEGGRTVHSANAGCRVHKDDPGQWQITCRQDGSVSGLTDRNGYRGLPAMRRGSPSSSRRLARAKVLAANRNQRGRGAESAVRRGGASTRTPALVDRQGGKESRLSGFAIP